MYSPITKEYDFLKKSPGVSTYSLQILRFRMVCAGLCEVNKPTCQDGHRFFAQKKAAAWGTIERNCCHSFIHID